ncbi:MAG TPA: hypothetical protein PK798_09680 [Flavobacteriales bacterium]|nr:hypothetical protein [Flavobacteriales bacterium]HRJ39047.1 hypothetical protein [Flavobacteriales bacterium]
MRFIVFTLFITICFVKQGFSQKPSEPVNSGAMLKKGIKLHDDKDFSGALEFYEKIPRNDTNYLLGLYERSLSLNALKRYEESAEVARMGLKFKSEYDSDFYVSLGSSLDELDKKEEAIEAYTEGIKRFPYNNMLYFNRAVTYRKMEKHQEAVDDIRSSIRLNPLHASSHYFLGLAALEEDKVIECLLAYNTFLLLEPLSDRSRNVVSVLDGLNKDKSEMTPKGIKLSPSGDDFSEIEELMRNRVFSSKNFKVPVKLDFFFVKQNYLLFQQLAEKEARYQKGFFCETYVPFFISLYKNGWFDEYTYLELITVADQSSDIAKAIKKKMSAIKKFIDWGHAEFRLKATNHRVEWNGKEQAVRHWYYGDRYLQSIGATDPTGTKAVGYWENFHSFGCLSEQINYDTKGNRQGLYKSYYSTGELYREITYVDGKADGYIKEYFKNGKISFHNELKNDTRHGSAKDYFLDGTIQGEYQYVDGKKNGKSIIYYKTNAVRYEVDYKDDKYSGKIKEYYPSGELKYEGEYVNGEVSGNVVNYFRDGKVESKYVYLNGKGNGPFETFYENGKTRSKGTMKNGKRSGKCTSWFENGQINEEEEFDDDGKGNGVQKEYDEDGKLIVETELKKGNLVAYKYVDKSGKVLSEGREEKGKMLFRGYYASGEMFSKGDVVKGNRDGIWSYYTHQGVLYKEEVYKETQITERRLLFPNGAIKEMIRYKDGMEEGAYEQWYFNGKYASTGWFNKGERNGYWHSYNADGTISSTAYYINGTPYGPQVDYSVSGTISAENYSDLEGNDIRWVFYDTTGKVIDDVDFSSTTGELVRRYSGGAVHFKGNYKNDWGHGKFTWYYFNGKVETEGQFEYGKRTGKWTSQHFNGAKFYDGYYKEGNRDSTWTYYYENGKTDRVSFYTKGDKTGEWLEYYENGQLASKKNYWRDYRHGASSYFSEDGQLRMIKIFSYGKVVSYSYMMADGKMSPEKAVDGGKNTIVAYYKNGNKSEEFSMDKFELEGKYVIYHPNGQVYERSEYKGGFQEGMQETFNANGKLRSSENYLNDELHGLCVYYDAAGNISEELNYKYGELHGVAKYYEKGKLVKTRVYYDDQIYSEEHVK